MALYLYKSTIRPCLEYCCHVWTGARSCQLNMLDKLQKRISRTVSPSLVHGRNAVSLSLFFRYYFSRCLSEVTELVPLPHSRSRSTRYCNRLHDFLSSFLDVIKMSTSTVSFLAQLDSGILCLQNAFLWPMI